jgi:transposase
MIPHLYLLEQLMFERVRERQREARQEQTLTGLWKPHHSMVCYLIGCLGIFFVAPGISMQQLVQPDQRAGSNCTRESVPESKETMVHPPIHAEEQLDMATELQTAVLERERLVQSGFSAEEIVALLWLRQWYHMGGSDRFELVRCWEFLRLLAKPQSGGHSRLTAAERRRLATILVRGPRAWGYSNDLWTLARVAEVIERRFNVRYHVSHVHRLLGQLGFSAQKPARLARERNDIAVEEFRGKRWSAIKKGAPRASHHRPGR